jgi:NAD(P)-dependent dehydrogenase (short-subunit alcohol dehydrogenase family)
MQIQNNVFVVTGGASGLGAATVRLLAAQGGKVVIADVTVDKGQALQESWVRPHASSSATSRPRPTPRR